MRESSSGMFAVRCKETNDHTRSSYVYTCWTLGCQCYGEDPLPTDVQTGIRACINVFIEYVHKICRQNLSKIKLCDWPNKLDATSWQVLNTTESVGMDRFYNCFGIYFFLSVSWICRADPKTSEEKTSAATCWKQYNSSGLKKKQLLRTRNSITDTPSSWFSCVLLKVRAANAGSGQQQLRARRVHRLWCIQDAPQQRARYHALHELLGFHISFEELVKRKKYLVLRVCPTLVQ